MKKLIFVVSIVLAVVAFSSFGAHKFYVAIHKINYAPQKKMLQITSRIFVDDINSALEKRYHRKFHFGEKEEYSDETPVLSKYVTDNFQISVNGKARPMQFMSCEMESNVLICYLRITEVPKVSSLTVTNKILFDYVTEQQNIIQTTVNGEKNSLLLTPDNPQGKITF